MRGQREEGDEGLRLRGRRVRVVRGEWNSGEGTSGEG